MPPCRAGRWTRYTTADGLSSNSVWAIDISPDGILWLGTLGGGLQQFNPATGKFGTPMLMSNSALPSHYINSLYRDRDNDLYAATPHGIARIDTRTLHVTRLSGTASGRQEFCNQNINQVLRDSRGLMWVGTREGLDMYDMKADTIYNVQLDPKFSSLFILGIIEGRDRGLHRTIIEPAPDDVKITSLDEQLIEKAVKYVEENMGRSDLTVEQLSQALGMSRVHLYKKTLTITGKTPIEFIRVLRLKRAAQYLRESQLSVAEIAYKIGFNNPKYFSKYFREEFGISPSDYVDKKD